MILFILTVSFPFHIIPSFQNFTGKFFEPLTLFTAKNIFGVSNGFVVELVSDSTGLYVHQFNLLLISIVVAVLLQLNPIAKSYSFQVFLIVLSRYYLAFIMFTYGFSKIFKWQFYYPEPNVLFSNFGNLSKDILYWSVTGTSHLFSLVTGSIEVLIALLVLFRRTAFAGGLLALVVLANIILINFSFNISVKLFTFFLLLLALILIFSDYEKLLFLFGIRTQPHKEIKSKEVSIWFKIIVLIIMIFEVLFPYFQSGNFNDDISSKPPLYGAYTVTVIKSKDAGLDWKRIFFHRHDYFIIENSKEEMFDYKIEPDYKKGKLLLVDQNRTIGILNVKKWDLRSLELDGILEGDTFEMEAVKINLDSLMVKKRDFSWTIDQ